MSQHKVGKYIIDSKLFKQIYELTSVVEGLEIFLVIDETGFKLQSYNQYNTYLYNYDIRKQLFIQYDYVAINNIKFKYIPDILKTIEGDLEIVLDEQSIHFNVINSTLSFDYMIPDDSDIIPKLQLGEKYQGLVVNCDLNLVSELNSVCEKIADKVNLNIKTDSIIFTTYNFLASIRKRKQIAYVNKENFEIDIVYTPRFKKLLSNLKNFEYTINFFKSENLVEVISDAGFQFIIMGECLTVE